MKKLISLILLGILISGCKTVTKKVDEVSKEESERLGKFLNKTESELKIEFGKPDFIEVSKNKNKTFIYYDSKFKIKCERRFEIDSNSIVISYNSKNCF
tara:strand:+ start:257 stop:553 length:297 start_codon:yes stop_codon:yes gene_type:complete